MTKMTTMNASATRNKNMRIPWWSGAIRLLGAATGMVAVTAPASSVSAQGSDYRSAIAAPGAWQTFGTALRQRFEQRLADDDEAVLRLREAMARREGQSSQMLVRTWIAPGGTIERLSFDSIDESDVTVNLRAVLASVVMPPPPADMLQPLHLRLSLRASGQPGKEQ